METIRAHLAALLMSLQDLKKQFVLVDERIPSPSGSRAYDRHRRFFKTSLETAAEILDEVVQDDIADERFDTLIYDDYNRIYKEILRAEGNPFVLFGPDTDEDVIVDIQRFFDETQIALMDLVETREALKNMKTVKNTTNFRGLRKTVEFNATAVAGPLTRYVKPRHRTDIENAPHFTIRPNKSVQSAAIQRAFLMAHDTPSLQEWLRRQASYVSELSWRDKCMLRGYTHKGDVLLNSYCRGNLREDITDLMSSYTNDAWNNQFMLYFLFEQYDTFKRPLTLPPKALLATPTGELSEEGKELLIKVIKGNLEFFGKSKNILTLLEQFKRDLVRIMLAAPRRRKPITVYRGFKHEKHVTKLKFVNPDFVSSSLSVAAAMKFSRIGPDNYGGFMRQRVFGGVYEITIAANVPCIYLEPATFHDDEQEILFPPGMTLEMDDTVVKKAWHTELDETNFLSDNPTSLLEVPRTVVAVVHVSVSARPSARPSARSRESARSSSRSRASVRRTVKTAKDKRLQRTLNVMGNLGQNM